MTVSLHRGFFIIVLDLRLTKWVRGCREIAFNFFYLFHFSARGEERTDSMEPNTPPLEMEKVPWILG